MLGEGGVGGCLEGHVVFGVADQLDHLPTTARETHTSLHVVLKNPETQSPDD